MSKHIEVNVVENGTTTGASPSHDKGPSTAFLTAIQEGFVQKSANMANAITEAFKSFKANFKTFPMMMTLKRKIPSIQTVRANQCDNCDVWYQTKCTVILLARLVHGYVWTVGYPVFPTR